MRPCVDARGKHSKKECYYLSFRGKLSRGRVLKLCTKAPHGKLTETQKDSLHLRGIDI